VHLAAFTEVGTARVKSSDKHH